MQRPATYRSRVSVLSSQVLATNPLAAATGANLASPGDQRILSGIRVLELATVVAAPSACAILADFGAEVLKVENPEEPDYVRAWRLNDDPAKTAQADRLPQQVGTGFTQFNRGKQAIALNYQKASGLRILKQLLAEVDVLVTNVRIKGLKKLGLDYASLAHEFPKLIYAHLSAWGLQGPRRDDPGYDVGAFYAYTGLMELTRSSEEAPLPRYPAAFGDLLTGTQLVAGIALALFHRQATGEGQLVDASLLRTGTWAMSHPITAHAAGNKFAAGARPTIRGSTVIGERRTMITDASFRCKDGRWIMLLGVESRRHWTKTIHALGLSGQLEPDWAKARHMTDWRAATSLVDEMVAQKTYDEWHEIFMAADVWHTPIHRYEDLMTDTHANEVGCFTEVPGVAHKLVKNPIFLSSQKGKDMPTAGAPGFGEHTTPVLLKLGYSSEDIRKLTAEGVVK